MFFKNLKDSLPESNLRISKLDLKAGSLDKIVNSTASTIDNAPYIFEITNMSEDELKTYLANIAKEAKKEKEEKEKREKEQAENNQ